MDSLTQPNAEVKSDNDSILDKIDWSEAALNPDQLHAAKQFVSEWSDIFSHNDNDIGLTSLVKHRIELSDPRPFKQRYRHIPKHMYDEVKKHLNGLLDAKVIRPSFSPWCSNIVLVRKRDSGLRMCVDFRQLNNATIPDAYTLPRIEDILDGLSGTVLSRI